MPNTTKAAETRVVDWQTNSRARRRSDLRLLGASRPLAWLLLHGFVRNRRDVVRIPRLGYVITGAVACREAATDSERFRKDGPKSAGALLTQVMGDTALLNIYYDAQAEEPERAAAYAMRRAGRE